VQPCDPQIRPAPPSGHSFIGEAPDPSCFSDRDGSFGSETSFADGINSARQMIDQMVSAANATDLLNQANPQGTQGWELLGVAVDASRPDKYVGFLKRKKQ
jgi:hypothetical protein